MGDAARLDEDRRLPNDHPSIVRARRKEGLSDAQLDQLRSEVIRVRWEEGHPILMAVRRSPEFKRLQTKMQDHPGPQSRLAPDLLMAAVILAVEQHNLAWRSIVCQIINGTDTRLWHEARMCDHQTRGDPISFSTTIRQLERLELFTSGVARNEHKPHRKESTNGATSGDQPKEWPTPGLRRLISDILAATIPKRRLKRATAISIDQTDFESFYVPHQRLKQAEADRAVAEALANGDDPPDDFQLGPDGKLIRCADIHARGGHRSATATRKAGPFTGYMATIAVLVRSATWSGRPTKCRLGSEVPPYICSLSVDPATDSVDPIAQRPGGLPSSPRGPRPLRPLAPGRHRDRTGHPLDGRSDRGRHRGGGAPQRSQRARHRPGHRPDPRDFASRAGMGRLGSGCRGAVDGSRRAALGQDPLLPRRLGHLVGVVASGGGVAHEVPGHHRPALPARPAEIAPIRLKLQQTIQDAVRGHGLYPRGQSGHLTSLVEPHCTFR